MGATESVNQPPAPRTTAAGVQPVGSEDAQLEITTKPPSSADESDAPRWLCVLGASLFLMSSFGFSQSIGTVQSHLQLNQLQTYSAEDLGWITGLDTALALLLGLQIGPVVDRHGPLPLAPLAACLTVSKFFLLAECTEYWHFLLCLGVQGGLGSAASSSLAVASVGKLFSRRRGLATGAALAGSSLGGVAFPLVLRRALPRLGWAWSMRLLGFGVLGLMALGTACLVPFAKLTGAPPLASSGGGADKKPSAALLNFEAFRSVPFAFITAGLFLFEISIIGVGVLLPTFAVRAGFPSSSGFALVAVLNGSSCLGRLLPGFAGDHVGHFDVILFTVALTSVFTAVLFVPFGTRSVGVLYAFAGLWGFGSGSFLSITPVCVGKTCDPKDYGRYYGTCTFVVAFGALASVPAGGALLEKTGSTGAASLYLAGVILGGVCFYVARSLLVRKWMLFRSNI
ncbi:putative transporter MCH4 [Colletotrichum orbiculare MAFF 240422]|uniref:Transporter MCH4 n=1 Tax=Colletotrichum orbiculare (strain 104-T / ATCC 96160 / CBS 514.97 / LARS 414 / MAFF 240422) TaxID=1213857 RepID=N4V3W5_COLOR|nr:putative transporter MCH4 [Colletotrichum orbiculare MAFF 240422]